MPTRRRRPSGKGAWAQTWFGTGQVWAGAFGGWKNNASATAAASEQLIGTRNKPVKIHDAALREHLLA